MVPAGYTARVLIAWGDPVSDGPEFKPDAGNTAFEQEWQWGMHNDGLVYFPIHGSARGLVVQNHEYTDDELLFPDGTANWDEEKTKKSLAAHGSTVVGDKYGSPDGLYGFRPTSRAARSIRARMRDSATTRCSAPIRTHARRAGSSSVRTSAR